MEMKKFLDFLAIAIENYGKMEMKRLGYLHKR